MAEINLSNSVHRLDEIYSILLKGEIDSGQEATLRVEIIDILSSIQATILTNKEKYQAFISLLEQVREMVLNWDPFNQWFRQQKELMKTLYEVIVQCKNILISQESDQITETSRLKSELNSLKSELNDLRSLMSELLKSSTVRPISENSQSLPIMEPIINDEETPQTIDDEIHEEIEGTIEIDNEEFPPLILPRDDSSEEVELESQVVEPSKEIEHEFKEELEEEPIIIAQKTIKKLSQKEDLADKPSSVLSQMKEIIHDAEEETQKQIQSFKESIAKTSEKKILGPKDDFIERIPQIPKSPSNQTSESSVSEETLVKPSEVLKRQKDLETSLANTSDPYMQLITLEAEKYRLEMQIEKNETDFQEGLKNKKEFDESIRRINEQLAIIRQKIDSLRKELLS